MLNTCTSTISSVIWKIWKQMHENKFFIRKCFNACYQFNKQNSLLYFSVGWEMGFCFVAICYEKNNSSHSKCRFSKNIGTIHVKLVDLLPSPYTCTLCNWQTSNDHIYMYTLYILESCPNFCGIAPIHSRRIFNGSRDRFRNRRKKLGVSL